MKKLLYCFLIVLIVAGCREAYISPVKSPVTGYLVVEGVVNSGQGFTIIKLSRTTRLDSLNHVYETGANVTVEGEDNSQYQLFESSQGQYVSAFLNLNPALKYRLHINVSSGKEYRSDFAVVKNNPPIDSVSYKRENGDGVQLYINTHDPQNNTLYYQWEYDETWQIQSSYLSYLKYQLVPTNHYSVVYKDSSTFSYDHTILNCWQYNTSTSLLLGSTAKLSQDMVYLPIAFVPHGSVKISYLYSINVKQYSWTKDGYAFLDKMRKNTEATGSIFDAQPSELHGNIHCVSDSTEPVIGYFNICPVQEKRIFISPADVPSWGYQSGCYATEITNNSDSIIAHGLSLMPATVSQPSPTGGIASFLRSSCRMC